MKRCSAPLIIRKIQIHHHSGLPLHPSEWPEEIKILTALPRQGLWSRERRTPPPPAKSGRYLPQLLSKAVQKDPWTWRCFLHPSHSVSQMHLGETLARVHKEKFMGMFVAVPAAMGRGGGQHTCSSPRKWVSCSIFAYEDVICSCYIQWTIAIFLHRGKSYKRNAVWKIEATEYPHWFHLYRVRSTHSDSNWSKKPSLLLYNLYFVISGSHLVSKTSG